MVSYDELIADLEMRKARMMKVLGKVKELGDESSQEMLRGSLHMLDILIEDYEQLALEEEY